jgi:hypothetical protein
MINNPSKSIVALALLSTLNFPVSTALAQGTAFTYQGQLNEGANPATGIYDLRFAIYDSPGGGTQQGNPVTNSATSLSNGLFTVILDFGNQFTGPGRWLEIGVRTNGGDAFTALIPRQPLTPTPYAIFAENVGSGGIAVGVYSNAVTFSNAANIFSGRFSGNGLLLTNVNAVSLGGLSSSNFWKLGGNAGANPASGNFLGTTDNLPLELRVNGRRALRLEPKTDDSNHSNIVNVINGCPGNFVSGAVFGATISGGGAIQDFALVAATNIVAGDFGTVGGGLANTAWGFGGTVGGGHHNTAGLGELTTVGGGEDNIASGDYATISGGLGNVASGSEATIGGGEENTGGGNHATVGGGFHNTANGAYSTVGGGENNIANGPVHSTVAGGDGNIASNSWATVGGGGGNVASGYAATVPGGAECTAAGDYSFAAGTQAKANHTGTFVWADSQIPNFASTAANQFLIRAQNGVGIGNNNPQAPLHVTGGGDAGLGGGGNIISGLVSGQNVVIDNNEIISRNNGLGSDLILNFGSGSVGIGRTPAANRLEVAGEASKTTAGSWLSNSDARIKTGIRTVTNALEKLSQVRLVQFRYTDDYRNSHPEIQDRDYLNVVAQEFQKVFPEDVKRSGEKLASGEDILQVDTYPLTIYTAAGVQELKQNLEEKAARISVLEEELSELKQAVKTLQTRRSKL